MEQSESRRRRTLSDSEKRAYVLRQVESGKTLAAFCRDEDLVLSSFQNWKKKFAVKSAFVEIASPVRQRPVPVEVFLASGDKVVTTSDCDPSWLAKLVRSFGAPPC
jgi:transposase-like protein